MMSTDSTNNRWLIIAGACLLLGFFSFCAAHRIYTLENKEPEVKIREVPKYIEVTKPCPSPPPVPQCTPPPPPPFQVLPVGKKWNAGGQYQASYQVIIPADGTWHNSKIEVSEGVKMIWNYDQGYSGGLSVRVGSMEYTKYLPLDYDKAFFERKFIKKRDYGDYEKDEIIIESPRYVEFKALENEVVIRVELWEYN
jgi:hypothetical protein